MFDLGFFSVCVPFEQLSFLSSLYAAEIHIRSRNEKLCPMKPEENISKCSTFYSK